MLFFEIISFALFVVFALYIPGKFISSRIGLRLLPHEELFFATGFGLMMFTLFSYIFSWVNLPFITIIILLIIDIFAIKQKKFLPEKLDKNLIKPLLLVTLLCFIFSSYMLATGKFGNSIIVRHDDIWHLALINEMKTNFPPDNPGFAGVPLKAYHFFNDFLGAKISNASFISTTTIHFWFIPILYAFLWGFGVFSLMYTWSKKISASLWAVFLTMFGGSFAFTLELYGHTGFSWASALGIDQPFDALYNAPFAVSIIILILIFFTILNYLKTKNYFWLIPLALFVGIISMFKVYGGIIAIAVFGLFFFHQLIHKRFLIIPCAIAACILFLSTYGYFAAGAGSLIFFPLWAPHRVLQAFPWYGYDEKMLTFKNNNVIKGLITTEIDALATFIIGNLGTRAIGLLLLPLIFIRTRRAPSFFSLLLLSATLVAFFIPLLFIQTGQVFETIQLAWYFLFFAALAAALGFSNFFDLKFNKILKIIIFIILIIFTLPSAYGQSKEFQNGLTNIQSLKDPNYSALTFLAKQGSYNQTVLELPGMSTRPTNNDIKDWYNSSNTQISAFGNKRSFYNNEYNSFPGRNVKERIAFLKKIITFTKNPKAIDAGIANNIIKDLKKNNIVFVLSPYVVPRFTNLEQIKLVYQKESTTIYKIL